MKRALWLALSMTLAACVHAESEVAEDDVQLLQAAHAAADTATTVPQRGAAIDKLAQAFESLPSAGTALLAKQDLAYRAALLCLEQQQAERAKAWAERGLSLSEQPHAARANLLLVLADAERALHNPEGERMNLMEALRLNQRLLDEELKDP